MPTDDRDTSAAPDGGVLATHSVSRPRRQRGSAFRPGGTEQLLTAQSSAGQSPRIIWPFAISIAVIHLAALLALLPWFFSWTGVAAAALGLYVFGTLGINLCFHRLLTHRAFRLPLWLEHTFAVLGVLCLQHSLARWVATHRLHHQHSDEQLDPHSPFVTFFWAHMGWLLVENPQLSRISTYEHYSRDILQDPFYMRLERHSLWIWLYAGHALLYFCGGFAAGWISTGNLAEAGRFGTSLVVWGVIVRTVLVWHITWSINSVTHVWGYRNYATDENSRNNWLVALISNGEGWHNNHHADQRSAAHGHKWWEFDVTYQTIRLLELVGLADQVARKRS